MKILRFSPSPTNQNENVEMRGLHIGGVRTLLFNYLVASKQGNQIFLRIEDTDAKRSNIECIAAMDRDFRWLGVKFKNKIEVVDGKVEESYNDPVGAAVKSSFCQSKRLDKYKDMAKILLDKGLGYVKDGATYFSMPKEKVSYYDGIQGFISLPKEDCQDFVIIKSDGMPSFYFAVTVDDASMAVTDVMRGTEHINTTFRQIALCKALGRETPNFYHIPIVLNADGSKMSKRQTSGQVNLWEFVKDGYVKEAIVHYVLSLGWTGINKIIDKNTQTLKFSDAITMFAPEDINKSMPRFDYKKLDHLNSIYLRTMSKEVYSENMIKYGKMFYEETFNQLTAKGILDKFLTSFYGRIRTMKDAWTNCNWMINDPGYEVKQIEYLKLNYPDYKRILKSFKSSVGKKTVDEIINDSKEKYGLKTDGVVQPVRIALTGGTVSPSLNCVIDIVTEDVAKNRISNLLEQL